MSSVGRKHLHLLDNTLAAFGEKLLQVNQTNQKCVAFLHLCSYLWHKSKSFISCVCFKCCLFVVFMPLCQCVWWHYVSRLFPSCERDQTFFRFGDLTSVAVRTCFKMWCDCPVWFHLFIFIKQKTGETSWLTVELLTTGCGRIGWNCCTTLCQTPTVLDTRILLLLFDTMEMVTHCPYLLLVMQYGCKSHWCMEAYNHRVLLVGPLKAAFVLCFFNLQDVGSVTVFWAIVPAATMKCDSTN